MSDDPLNRMWFNIKRQLHDERPPMDPLPLNSYRIVPYTIRTAITPPSAIALTPETEKALWQAADEMLRKVQADLLGVDPLKVSNTPLPQPALTADHLKELMHALDAKDPLIQKGIKRDWLCIINPGMERLLRDLIQQGQIRTPPTWEPSRNIDQITGRWTHVIDEAHEGIVYMDEKLARWAYPAYFARLADERLKMLRDLDTGLLEEVRPDEEETSDQAD